MRRYLALSGKNRIRRGCKIRQRVPRAAGSRGPAGSRLGENELSNMIKDLQKAIEEKEPSTCSIAPWVDHKETISKYLTEEAANAMKTKYKGLHLYEDGQLVAQCVYFSLVVRSEKIEDGLAEIAKIANTLAERGLIKAVLCPPSSLRLARIPLQAPVSAVFFFPLVPVNMVKEIKRDYKYSIEEGSVGEYFDADGKELFKY